MLLLPNIICISCFSTCNAHSCHCLPQTVSMLDSVFFLFECDKMDSNTGACMFCYCSCLDLVISWDYRYFWAEQKAEDSSCVLHVLPHFAVRLDFLWQGRLGGFAPSLSKWNIQSIRKREKEKGCGATHLSAFFLSSLRLSSPPHCRKESAEDVEFCLLTSCCV